MDTGEYLKRYFEYLKDKPITAANIRNATAASGEPPAPALEFILIHAEAHGINPKNELAELFTAWEKSKSEKREQKETAAAITEFENLAKEYRDNEAKGFLPTEKQRADLSARAALSAARIGNTATKNPFISFDQYIYNKINKNWWEEFSPELYNRLPFPDGTVSAIGSPPGGGKTASLINIGRELLTAPPPENPIYEKAQEKNTKRNILFISAEMTVEAITDRFIKCIAWETGRNNPRYGLENVKEAWDYEQRLKDIYKGDGELIAHNEIEAARAGLYKQILDKYIYPAWGKRLQLAYVRGYRYFEDIANIIRTRAEPGTIILMDYIQLFPPMRRDAEDDHTPRYLQIRRIIDETILAAELTKSVVICAAQLGRAERKEGSGKQADDTQGWRESGDIKQNAWNLVKMFLEVNEDNPAEKQMSYRVSKARSSGHLGEAYVLDWTPKYQHMERTITQKSKTTPWAQRAAEERASKKRKSTTGENSGALGDNNIKIHGRP